MSEKCHKGFSEINDSVNSSLQKWIIFLPHVIQSNIENDYITVNFDDGNGGVKNEIRQNVPLQVYVNELHKDMLKIYYTGFSMAYDEKLFVCISDSSLRLLLLPKLL